ncbi:MAG: orotidine-5'-phosphate decarboxylase [Bacteroidales bacterium]|nr:orotidine-5'-phosphate decarboxylase [Bacteroidales bacterium]
MNKQQLFDLISKKKSFLCIGLDSDYTKIPQHLLDFTDPQFEFNKAIIDTTSDLAAAYKINTAFYESQGVPGWISLEKTIDYIKGSGLDVFTIADAKRGDIGNTSLQYAKGFFETFDFDAITVSPYMGEDSIAPFLQYKNKWIIVLALTTNKGSVDFQSLRNKSNDRFFYEEVLNKTIQWGTTDNTMFVVGATKPESFKHIREIVPDHFLLVPGVGAQGGSLEEVSENGLNKFCGMLVNSSRGIIFASNGEDFARIAREKSHQIQKRMAEILTGI